MLRVMRTVSHNSEDLSERMRQAEESAARQAAQLALEEKKIYARIGGEESLELEVKMQQELLKCWDLIDE